jgi:hypothetical protein
VLISELLLPEFDEEMKKTRTTLERIPADKRDFAPHPRSMPLGKLAPHVAQLASFGLIILTTPELDFATANFKLAYRQMFINHIVHHRAQLGVYLRLNEAKVPAIYGPSADETRGF